MPVPDSRGRELDLNSVRGLSRNLWSSWKPPYSFLYPKPQNLLESFPPSLALIKSCWVCLWNVFFFYFLPLSTATTILWSHIPSYPKFDNTLPASGHSDLHSFPSELLPQIPLLLPSPNSLSIPLCAEKILNPLAFREIHHLTQPFSSALSSFLPCTSASGYTLTTDHFSKYSLIPFHLAFAQAAAVSVQSLMLLSIPKKPSLESIFYNFLILPISIALIRVCVHESFSVY